MCPYYVPHGSYPPHTAPPLHRPTACHRPTVCHRPTATPPLQNMTEAQLDEAELSVYIEQRTNLLEYSGVGVPNVTYTRIAEGRTKGLGRCLSVHKSLHDEKLKAAESVKAAEPEEKCDIGGAAAAETKPGGLVYIDDGGEAEERPTDQTRAQTKREKRKQKELAAMKLGGASLTAFRLDKVKRLLIFPCEARDLNSVSFRGPSLLHGMAAGNLVVAFEALRCDYYVQVYKYTSIQVVGR